MKKWLIRKLHLCMCVWIEFESSRLMLSQTWLLGYEFPSTLLVFTRDGVTFVTSSGKGMITCGNQNSD